MKRKKRRSHTFLPVLAGFLALYLMLMSIATFLVREQYMDKFETTYKALFTDLIHQIETSADGSKWVAEGNTGEASKYFSRLLNNALSESDSAWFQCSCALYDREQVLIARSRNMLSLSRLREPPSTSQFQVHYEFYDHCPIDEYLNQEDLKSLAYYMDKMNTNFNKKWRGQTSGDADRSILSDYRVSAVLVKGTNIPVQLLVQEMDWNGENTTDAGENLLHFPNYIWDHSATVWTWTNPDIDIAEEPLQHFFELEVSPGSSFPYLSLGYENWLSWQENEFLQDLRLDDEIFLTMNQYCAPESQRLPFAAKTKQAAEASAFVDEKDLVRYLLVIAADCHPWLAAMDSMKYFYLAGLACMLICAGVLTFFIRRTNRQREALEENRRDFTNAIAHELKTPLCVIRGSVENLKENTAARKREHYLDLIIQKTEEMDALAAEMIYVSRLDSDRSALKKESVCLNELIREQLKKFEDIIQAKKIGILFQPEDTFLVAGDRQYLEKAVWNLLSNAVSYNIEGGTIQISISKDQCRIENTGGHISENDLPLIFEMFYGGQERSGDGGKHLGLGLYLTRRICAVHHLTVTARNTEMGVAVILSRAPVKRRFMKAKSFAATDFI